jgi:hypothetical protein
MTVYQDKLKTGVLSRKYLVFPEGIDLEAIREPRSNVVPLSSSLLAVMKGRTIAWSEPVQHKMHMTNLDHSRTGFDAAFIVLTVAPIPPMPRVRALKHPALLQWRKAFRSIYRSL